MDRIAAGEMTKGAVVGESRDLLHKTWTEIDEQPRGPGQSDLERDGRRPHPRPLQGLRGSRPHQGGRLAEHAADHPREKIGQTLRRLQRLDRSTTPNSCDQTFPLPQRGDVFRLEERCSICDQTPRLKVVPFRGRPWNLCLNDDCESMQEMKKRRAEREAAKAAKAAMEKKPPAKATRTRPPSEKRKKRKSKRPKRTPRRAGANAPKPRPKAEARGVVHLPRGSRRLRQEHPGAAAGRGAGRRRRSRSASRAGPTRPSGSASCSPTRRCRARPAGRAAALPAPPAPTSPSG